MFPKQTKTTILKNCKLSPEEPIVQNGLAVTPSQMMELTNRGVPISPSNLGVIYDEGTSNLDFEPTMENLRGIDITDMWEHREDVKHKMKSKEFQSLLNTQENE